jgi:acyl-CoA dehydrogenase
MQVTRDVYREDHEMFRATARRFVERECVPKQAAWDKAGRTDRETWLKAGREGLLCVTMPAEYGGGGGDFGHCAIIAEELAAAGVVGWSAPLHSDIIAPYILRLGDEEQKQRWLPRMASGEMIFAIGMTEPGGGSDLKAVRTSAVRDGDEYVINGAKTFISNGLNCDAVLLVCKTDPAAGAKGISLIVVETNRPGFRRGRKLEKVGQPAADTAEMFFDDVRVPVGNRLGDENKGFAYMMHDLSQERFLIAVSAASALERLLGITLQYVKDRKAFNQTVWDFQNSKFKLADVKAQAVAVRALVDMYLREHMKRRLTPEEAAIAKLFTTEALWKCIDDMVQLHGGYGYMMEYPIAKAFTDFRVMRVYGGASEVMREMIARKL